MTTLVWKSETMHQRFRYRASQSDIMSSTMLIEVTIGTRKINIHEKVFNHLVLPSPSTTNDQDLTALFGKFAYNPEIVDYIVHILHLKYIHTLSAVRSDYITYNEQLFQIIRNECGADNSLLQFILDDNWFKGTLCTYHKELDPHHWNFGNHGTRIVARKATNRRLARNYMKACWSNGVLYVLTYDKQLGPLEVHGTNANPLMVDEFEEPECSTSLMAPTHRLAVWYEKIWATSNSDFKPPEDAIRYIGDDYLENWKSAAVGKRPGITIIAQPPQSSSRWRIGAPFYIHTHQPIQILSDEDSMYRVDINFNVERLYTIPEQIPDFAFIASANKLWSRNPITGQEFVSYDRLPNIYEICGPGDTDRGIIRHNDVEPLVQ